MRTFIDVAQKGIAIGLLFVLTLNCGRIGSELYRTAEYMKEILHDLDRLSDNGVTVMDVRHYDD